MASRAFFRCRACGEPVVASAYRCPVCGIDFPAGTPGAPQAPYSPAAVRPQRASVEGDGSRVDSSPKAGADATVAGTVAGQDWASEDWVPKLRPADASSDAAATSATEAGAVRMRQPPSLDRVPVPVDPHSAPADVELALTPSRERDEGDNAPLVVRAERAPRRRSLARGLTGTLLVALFALAGAGAIGLWLGRGAGEDAAGSGEPVRDAAAVEDLSVTADEGWVIVPAGDGPFVAEADGPFRVRVGGEVYTLDGDRRVRVAPGGGGEVAVRAVRAPTTVSVRPGE